MEKRQTEELNRQKRKEEEDEVHRRLSLLAMISWRSSLLTLDHFLELSHIIKQDENPQNLYKHIPSSFPELKRLLKSWSQKERVQNEREFEWCEKKKVSVLYPGHSDYPEILFQTEDPPLVLTYKGKTCWKNVFCLSVVGSRFPSLESLKWLDEHFSEILKRKKVLVVSGAAHGIDQKMHALSLRFHLPTLSLLPSGLDNIYPFSFQEWEEPILKSNGALMSAFSPFQRVYRSLFHQRNRIIASFSPLLFVVEARRRSGSLVTASMALELGKSICSLPCSPMNSKGQGSLDLIFEGAFMLRDHQDLMTLIESHCRNSG